MAVKLKPLHSQVVVLTGATSGIGLATARLASKRGARLVLAARNEEALKTLSDELQKRTDVETVVADVGTEDDVKRIAESAIKRFGGFDTWINNAGISIYGNVTDVSVEDQKRLFDTNYWGVVHGSRAAVEHLRAKGGALINLGSIVSDLAFPLQGAYCASKAAIKNWTDTLRIELKHDGIPVSVTLIKPSAINTPFTHHAKNIMDGKAELPPPAYSPHVVARAILHAAEYPIRSITVGGVGWMMTTMGSLFPSLTDKIMEKTLWKAQIDPSRHDSTPDDSLDGPTEDGVEQGDARGPVMNSSLFTEMQMRPLTSLAVAAAIGTAVTGLFALRSITRR